MGGCFAKPIQNPPNPPRTPLVLVVGPKREGKSSIVNMLVGSEVARVTSDIRPSHDPFQIHQADWDKTSLELCDTLGLDYAPPPFKSIKEGTRVHGEVGLVIYCMNARRLNKQDVKHVKSVRKAFCRKNVRLVLVLTRLEGMEDMQSWWRTNEAEFARRIPVRFADCIGVCALPRNHRSRGDKNYEDSQGPLRQFVIRNLRVTH
ncbi:hypothetical protein HYDPIDRAFT_107235 [Hydnomerulius pinastri MD-312]|nr:hypothetical protein HYDPIDRAFT_107235 [Hydnomerulius pinastri MD-312]